MHLQRRGLIEYSKTYTYIFFTNYPWFSASAVCALIMQCSRIHTICVTIGIWVQSVEKTKIFNFDLLAMHTAELVYRLTNRFVTTIQKHAMAMVGRSVPLTQGYSHTIPGMILGLHPANERRVTEKHRLSLAGRKARIGPVIHVMII